MLNWRCGIYIEKKVGTEDGALSVKNTWLERVWLKSSHTRDLFRTVFQLEFDS